MAGAFEGEGRFAAKLRKLPKAARDLLQDANRTSGTEFHDTVARIIPDGEGDLKSTLQQSEEEDAVEVSIGSAEHRYPLHLEAGHMGPDGRPVPGKPFWYPAKRATAKSRRKRARQAIRAAVKIAKGTGA